MDKELQLKVEQIPQLKELIKLCDLQILRITYLDKYVKDVKVIMKRKKSDEVDMDKYHTYMDKVHGIDNKFLAEEILNYAINDNNK
jgi:hypothetical protein